MKLDQETVVKHQFWFLLGGYFLLWLVAVMWMKFTYPAQIEEFQKSYDGASKEVKTAFSSGPVNTSTFVPPWDKETKEFSAHKGVIWEQAWKVQEDMYDWPEPWRKKYDLRSPQVQISPDDRYVYMDKLYQDQIKNVRDNAPKYLNPVELKDGFDSVFKPMTRKDWEETPTREEIWLAQEDYWVKRELLIVVYAAMAQQALMQPVPIDEKETMPPGVEARQRFRNKNWEITLNIRKGNNGLVIGGDSTIKNIHPSRQPQPLTSAKGKGIWFNIAQDGAPTTFEVRGEPVGWSETKNFSKEDYPDSLSGIKWDKETLKDHPIYVSQGFDQTNCPIRRLNAIELAKQDCRTFVWPLQPNQMLAQLDALPEEQDPTKKADATSGATGGAGGAGAGGMVGGSSPAMMGGSGSMRPGGMGVMGGGGTAQAGNRTPNNHIERNRYLQPPSTDKQAKPLPSRHLPLAIQLIVEQSHMHDILLALANSRLRFQITQVEFKHEKNFVPQSEGDKDNNKKDGGQTAESPRIFNSGGSQQMRMQMQMQMQMRGSMQGPPGGGDPMSRGGGAGPSGMMRGGPGMSPGGPPQGMMSGMMGGMRGGPPQGMMGGGMRGGAGGPMMGMRPPAGAAPMGGPQAQSRFSFAPGNRQGVLAAAGIASQQTASNQSDDNLLELTIYGIATLYRAPDAPEPTQQTAASGGTPATQSGQQQAAPPGAATQQSGTAPAPTAPQPGVAAPPQTNTTPAPQPNNTSPPPANTGQPGGGAAPKQGEKTVDQQKAPPPPPPPAGKKP